jgi:hypothetical protein
MTNISFLKSLEVLHWVQNQHWPAIHQVYETAPPHETIALNLVRKSGLRDIATRLWNLTWIGPHTVILTMPATAKVNRIRT